MMILSGVVFLHILMMGQRHVQIVLHRGNLPLVGRVLPVDGTRWKAQVRRNGKDAIFYYPSVPLNVGRKNSNIDIIYIMVYTSIKRAMMHRVMITLPQDFLDEMDRLARREHRSRSELIREAVRHYMARADEKAENRQEAIRRALRVQAEARKRTSNVSFDSTEFIREWREGSNRPNP